MKSGLNQQVIGPHAVYEGGSRELQSGPYLAILAVSVNIICMNNDKENQPGTNNFTI